MENKKNELDNTRIPYPVFSIVVIALWLHHSRIRWLLKNIWKPWCNRYLLNTCLLWKWNIRVDKCPYCHSLKMLKPRWEYVPKVRKTLERLVTSVAHHRRLSAPDCHSDRLAPLPSALNSTSKGDYLWYLLVQTLHILDFIIWNMAQQKQSKPTIHWVDC